MADPQLAALAKHCRREAAADGTKALNTLDDPLAASLAKRVALWLQLADEIDAYLAGQLADMPPPDDRPVLFTEGDP